MDLMMKSMPEFQETKEELIQEQIYKKKYTICLDIESIFLRKVNISEEENLRSLDDSDYQNYIIVK